MTADYNGWQDAPEAEREALLSTQELASPSWPSSPSSGSAGGDAQSAPSVTRRSRSAPRRHG